MIKLVDEKMKAPKATRSASVCACTCTTTSTDGRRPSAEATRSTVNLGVKLDVGDRTC